MAKTLTTANSALTFSFRDLFPVPVPISGYSTDSSFTTGTVTPSERQMGVDGKLSGGYVPYVTPFEIMLQADSDSTSIFDDVLAAQVAAKELYIVDAVLVIQGSQEKCIYTKGFISEMDPAPKGAKVLQPRRFAFEFEQFSKSPI